MFGFLVKNFLCGSCCLVGSGLDIIFMTKSAVLLGRKLFPMFLAFNAYLITALATQFWNRSAGRRAYNVSQLMLIEYPGGSRCPSIKFLNYKKIVRKKEEEEETTSRNRINKSLDTAFMSVRNRSEKMRTVNSLIKYLPSPSMSLKRP